MRSTMLATNAPFSTDRRRGNTTRVMQVLMPMLFVWCASCDRGAPRFSGQLAAAAAAMFSDASLHCRDWQQSECWTTRGDTTAYYYANSARSVRVIGRQWHLVDGIAAQDYAQLLASLDRRYGPSSGCTRADSIAVPHYRTWQADKTVVALIVLRSDAKDRDSGIIRLIATVDRDPCAELYPVPRKM